MQLIAEVGNHLGGLHLYIDIWFDTDQKRIRIDGESQTYPRSSAISVNTLTQVAREVGSSGNAISKSVMARTSERTKT